jgi:apolipoprotein N-acyltransferase
VEGRTGTTPFAWWAGRFGLWPLWILCGLIVSAFWVRRHP